MRMSTRMLTILSGDIRRRIGGGVVQCNSLGVSSPGFPSELAGASTLPCQQSSIRQYAGTHPSTSYHTVLTTCPAPNYIILKPDKLTKLPVKAGKAQQGEKRRRHEKNITVWRTIKKKYVKHRRKHKKFKEVWFYSIWCRFELNAQYVLRDGHQRVCRRWILSPSKIKLH